MKKKIIFGLQILLSIALLGWMIVLLPVSVWRELAVAPLHYIALAVLNMVGVLALNAFRLYRLLQGILPGEKFGVIFKGTWLGYFCSSFLPSSVGGDAVKLVWLTKNLGNSATILAGMVVERVLNLCVTIVIAGVFIVQSASSLDSVFSAKPSTLWVLTLCIAGLALCYATGVWATRSQHRYATLLRGYAGQVREALQYWKQHPWRLFETVFWSAAALTLAGSGVLLPAAWTVGVDISALQAIGCIASVTLLALIPVALNGIGIYEAGLVGLLITIGVSEANAVQAAIALRFVLTLSSIPGACWLRFSHFGKEKNSPKN